MYSLLFYLCIIIFHCYTKISNCYQEKPGIYGALRPCKRAQVLCARKVKTLEKRNLSECDAKHVKLKHVLGKGHMRTLKRHLASVRPHTKKRWKHCQLGKRNRREHKKAILHYSYLGKDGAAQPFRISQIIQAKDSKHCLELK